MAQKTPVMSSPDPANNWLLSLYRRYLGEPARTTDVFVGFGLFFAGIALGAIGLVVFLASATVQPESTLFWRLREIAIVLTIIGIPGLLLSVVVLLPVSTRAVYAGMGGVTLCIGATGVFVITYPQAWNVAGTDHSPLGITLYAGGLTILLGATGAALVAHHLERARPSDPSQTTEPSSAPQDDPVTDEEVQADIEESVAAADLTWGGVEPEETRRLTLTHTESEEELDASGLDVATEVRSDAGVDDSVSALRKLRGWEPPTERGADTEDQVAALRTLREQSEDADEEESFLRTVVDRFRRE